MALIDTGLGWYADENWLKHSSGLMGSIAQGGGFGDRVYEQDISFYDNPTLAASKLYYYQGYQSYIAANNDDTIAILVPDSTNNFYYWVFASSKPNSIVWERYYNTIRGTWHTTGGTYQLAYDSSRNIYTYYHSLSSGTERNSGLGVFYYTAASIQDAYNEAARILGTTGNTHYYKMNTGYAVSVTATYNSEVSPSGQVTPGISRKYVVPILISSTPAYTNISETDPSGGTATNIAQRSTHALYDIVFTMGIGESYNAEDVSISTPGSMLVDLGEMGDNTPRLAPDGVFRYIARLASIGVGSTDDPYSGGGTSTPGGGDGTFDFDSTDIDFPGLPSIGGYATGFTTMYNPTAANLKNLADYMWAGAFDYENFRKLFADPMDAIIGLSIVPLTQAQIPGDANTLVVGNISTGISMKSVSQQYVKVSMGTVSVPPKWGAYLDYAPYTKLQLFLPYIGFVDIAPDDVVGYSISVEYTVDLLSGTCIALVKTNGHVLYSFGANCSCACPVTSGQYKNGAIGAVEIAGTVASTVSQLTPSLKGLKKGKLVSGVADKIAAVSEGALDTFDTVQAMIKPAITRSGSIGSAVGLMGIQIPYLILTVPRMCIPGDQNVYMGYPSFVTQQMSDLMGYTEIQVTHLNGMSCTDVEATEIISLLERGVIF